MNSLILGLAAVLVASVAASPALVRQAAPVNACPVNQVCFVMDRSGSIGPNFPIEQSFVISISQSLAALTTDIEYSAVSFSTDVTTTQTPTPNLAAFETAINVSLSTAGGTAIGSGLNACSNLIMGKNGNRVIVLITDGIVNGGPPPEPIATQIKAAGITIVTVGIGNGVNVAFLQRVATAPNFFVQTSFGTLGSSVVQVTQSSCAPPPNGGGPVVGSGTCQQAYDACGFYFNNSATVPTVSVDDTADNALTGGIVSRNMSEKVGIVNTNNIEVEFITNNTLKLITAVNASQTFSPTQFKPFTIVNTTFSGIGFETFQGDQMMKARNQCVRVFFSQYQTLKMMMPYYVKDNINAKRSDNKCVVFRTI